MFQCYVRSKSLWLPKVCRVLGPCTASIFRRDERLQTTMARQTTQKRKAVGVTAANGPTPKGFEVSHVTTFERPDLLILLGLAVVTFGIYAQVIGHRFTNFDEFGYITENSMVNRGVTLGGLAWAFTTLHAGNWHPLTWIAHMIDSQLFGTFAGGHLLVNALIHAANTLLVFWFLLRTTHARWSSALVAALFALHPLHVESVAWAAERKDTLSTFFGLLSLIAYVRYAEAPSSGRYVWTAVTLALGLMSKPMLVTLPFVMLLLDYWPLGRLAGARKPSVSHFDWSAVWPLVREKVPFFILSAASAAVAVVAQRQSGAMHSLTNFPTLVRVIGLVQLGHHSMADRYSYWPLIGLFIALTWLTGRVVARLPYGPAFACSGAVAALIACSVATNRQLRYWQDSVSLFGHTV